MKVNRFLFIFFSFVLGCLIAWYFSNIITGLVFGLSFSGRSLKTQIILFLFYAFTASLLFLTIHIFVLKHKRVHSLIFLSFLAIACFLIIRVLYYQYQLITFPYQLEYREGATLLFTQGILEGKNIFSLNQAPLYTNGYGVVYNLIVLPFAKLFGNTLCIHRIFTALFSYASSGLVFYFIYKKNKNTLAGLFGGILFIISQLYWVIPTARADAAGLFLLLLSVFIPYSHSFSLRSLALSAIIGLISFYTKPYFLISIPIIASYLFLFISKKKSLIFSGISIVIFLISVFIVNHFYETYFYNVVYVHTQIVSDQISHAIRQLYQFLLAYFPLIIAGILILFSEKTSCEDGVASAFNEWKKSMQFNLLDFPEPLIKPKTDMVGYFLLCSTLAIFLALGRHIGNYMVYLFQLMTPFLIVLILGRLTPANPYRNLILLFLVVNIISFRADYILNIDQSDWQKAEEYIKSSHKVLNSPPLTSILLKENKPIIDSGQTQYFFVPLDYISNYFLPNSAAIKDIQNNYKQAVQSEIRNQIYDYVMISTWDSPFTDFDVLNESYQLFDTLYLPMPQSNQSWLKPIENLENHDWEISVWKPK